MIVSMRLPLISRTPRWARTITGVFAEAAADFTKIGGQADSAAHGSPPSGQPDRSAPAPGLKARAGTAPFRSVAFRANRVCGFSMHRIVTHFEGGVVHPERHENLDHEQDGRGCDDIEGDDEGRGFGLHHKLVSVAIEEPGTGNARR